MGQYYFAVLGNPCDRPEQLEKKFVQPYGWGGETMLKETAPEVRCGHSGGEDGTLLGATLSDHGFIIIAMFFDAETPTVDAGNFDGAVGAVGTVYEQQPGRISVSPGGVHYQDERDWEKTCTERAAAGYNSGMGEIFRKVAGISPIKILSVQTEAEDSSCQANKNEPSEKHIETESARE